MNRSLIGGRLFLSIPLAVSLIRGSSAISSKFDTSKMCDYYTRHCQLAITEPDTLYIICRIIDSRHNPVKKEGPFMIRGNNMRFTPALEHKVLKSVPDGTQQTSFLIACGNGYPSKVKVF